MIQSAEQLEHEIANGPDSIVAPTGRISGDAVSKGTEKYADEEREAVLRLYRVYTEQALSLSELEKETDISATTLTQVFRGKYGAKLDGVIERINRYFVAKEKREIAPAAPFIEISLSKTIFDMADLALEFNKMSVIEGASHIGKTTALKEICRRNPNAVYTSVPDESLKNYMHVMADAVNVTSHDRIYRMRRRLIRSFNRHSLLIVDEAHQCIPHEGYGSMRGLRVIEFIREIYNASGCGVLLSATKVFTDALNDKRYDRLLGQTKRRCVATCQLPDVPTQVDLNAFAAHYGLPPSEGYFREIESLLVTTEALGTWLTILRLGKKIAAKQPMTWVHVRNAYAGWLKLQQKPNTERK